jgi:hypothetical protein
VDLQVKTGLPALSLSVVNVSHGLGNALGSTALRFPEFSLVRPLPSYLFTREHEIVGVGVAATEEVEVARLSKEGLLRGTMLQEMMLN